MSSGLEEKWLFWIDHGGPFTEIVARRPAGQMVAPKLLFKNPEQSRDAAIAALRVQNYETIWGSTPAEMGQFVSLSFGNP
ncbi:hypothetical protein [Thermosynechococcus sp.]|uniref:hypothetical protein n=1 Tax=Thermosynechococcus sp. TaxID=2814275 RepID=UPI00391BA922